MMVTLVCLSLFSYSVFSQSFFNDFQKINQQVGQNEVDSYIKTPSETGLNGSIMASFLPTPKIDPSFECTEKDELKNTHYEIILVAQSSTQYSELEILPGQFGYFATESLDYLMKKYPEDETSRGLTAAAVSKRASDIWNSGRFDVPNPEYDPSTGLGKELFIEALVHAAAKSNLDEKQLSKAMSSVIENTYKTTEEKFNILSVLSLRLYRNYNNLRNPGSNTSKANPYNIPIPEGDMSLNDILKGASNFNEFEGGVCNDVSEAVALVGEHLFPDKDVLVINGGSHFGVVVSDNEENRVINGPFELRSVNRLLLSTSKSPTNLRINKMSNGALKEIAVVDTEMGQLTEEAFQTGKTLLKTDADITSLVAHYKNKKLNLAAGNGKLSDSNVFIVVAKYENSSEKWKSYLGGGLTAQNYSYDNPVKYQVHLRAGVERNIFRYLNNNTKVEMATGSRLNGMITLNPVASEDESLAAQKDISGALDFYNRIDFQHTSPRPKGVNLFSSIEVEQTLGAKNWGNTTGISSKIEGRDVGDLLKNMNFHLNQVNANVLLNKPINEKLTAMTRAHYQGSNIGQSVGVLAGMDIKVPNGATLLVFSGYSNSDLPGYKTKHSLLAAPSGGEVGAKYKTKSGTEFNGVLRGISSEPSVNAGVKIPILNKKKKKD
jgi:hypothetical protein